jgi:hypothetical protein
MTFNDFDAVIGIDSHYTNGTLTRRKTSAAAAIRVFSTNGALRQIFGTSRVTYAVRIITVYVSIAVVVITIGTVICLRRRRISAVSSTVTVIFPGITATISAHGTSTSRGDFPDRRSR